MIHVSRIAFSRDVDRCARERGSVLGGEPPASRGPPREPWQPHAENRRLHLVEPRVHTGRFVVVAIRLAAVAQPTNAIGKGPVAGDDGASVAERTKILRRIEAEGAGYSDCAYWATADGR